MGGKRDGGVETHVRRNGYRVGGGEVKMLLLLGFLSEGVQVFRILTGRKNKRFGVKMGLIVGRQFRRNWAAERCKAES